ncbi:hypothetical protein NP493_68g04005 [Ridgeia piscesae]|uniref:Uncharacterized protein n=1 Tax=Ridgeia piscesae TaxID=27915 RepID=A0AAD9P9P6_RIDPI|nr:hypothetical protein NP493_68g04005 [Ridgeia piscesae]
MQSAQDIHTQANLPVSSIIYYSNDKKHILRHRLFCHKARRTSDVTTYTFLFPIPDNQQHISYEQLSGNVVSIKYTSMQMAFTASDVLFIS